MGKVGGLRPDALLTCLLDLVAVAAFYASIPRGSAILPLTALAATVYGDAKNTWLDTAPMRPLKLRAVEEMTRTFSPKRSSL